MSRNAERVHTDPAEIARIQDRIEQLPAGARVSLLMDDGVELSGIVAARPMIQLLSAPDGSVGTNALLRLEQEAMYRPETGHIEDVWLDRIVMIRRLDPAPQPGPVAGH